MINVAYFIAAVVIFTCFDICGYRFVGKFQTGKEPGIVEYRIIQFMFQASLCGLLVFLGGYMLAACFLFAWWLLVCDVLYYGLLGIPLEPFNWFDINPFVFISKRIFKEPAPVYIVIVSAIIGLLGGLIVSYSL